MRPATKCYMALISVLGLCTGVFCAYRFLLVLSGPWNLSYTGVFLVLLLFAWAAAACPFISVRTAPWISLLSASWPRSSS